MRYFTFTPLAILLILPLSLMSFGKKAPTQQLIEHIARQITGKSQANHRQTTLDAGKTG
jgi:hypothetical protein